MMNEIKSKPDLSYYKQNYLITRITLLEICLKQSVDVKLLKFNKFNQFLVKVFYFKFLVCLTNDVLKTQSFDHFSKNITK